jgi:hypothetical protein
MRAWALRMQTAMAAARFEAPSLTVGSGCQITSTDHP